MEAHWGGHEGQDEDVGLTWNNLIILNRKNNNSSCVLERPSVSHM